MIIAVGTNTENGHRILYLGLAEENIRRLCGGEPIYRRLDGSSGGDDVPTQGLEDWDLAIMGPEDTVRFLAQIRAYPADARGVDQAALDRAAEQFPEREGEG